MSYGFYPSIVAALRSGSQAEDHRGAGGLCRDAADEIERLCAALILARARIEYLGIICTDPRHFEANGEIYLPKIDAALSFSSGVLKVES